MARYKDAIRWIVENDDTDWLDSDGTESVTAAMVADLFSKTDEEVKRDLLKLEETYSKRLAKVS
jgi:hypothetical protein